MSYIYSKNFLCLHLKVFVMINDDEIFVQYHDKVHYRLKYLFYAF
jgi:hypothetical protein